MKETQVQKELIKSAIAMGGFGWQLNNRFIKGIADIIIKLPCTVIPVVAEVKMCSPLGRGHNFTLTLTEHQARFLRSYRDAGGMAAWIAVGKVPNKVATFNIICGTSIEEKQHIQVINHPMFVRRRGCLWPVDQIVDYLEGISH